MGRLSKAAKKKREAEIRKAVKEALASQPGNERLQRLETTLDTIQQLIGAVLKPRVVVEPPPKVKPPEQVVREATKIFEPPQLMDDVQELAAGEISEDDDMGEGVWV